MALDAFGAPGCQTSRCNDFRRLHANPRLAPELMLPRATMSETTAAAADSNRAAILVVDDEPGIVDSLQKVFEREGLRVLTARAGGEALEILRREPVSVLLTDLLMPGMSGMDLP